MDKYIKMSEKADEIQDQWRLDTQHDYKGDHIFVKTFKYYKRSFGRSHLSKFQLRDEGKENPSWVEAHNGIRGICTIEHFTYKHNFIKTDDSYPTSAKLFSLLRPRNPILDEEYLPIEWCIWLPRQDDLQKMVNNVPAYSVLTKLEFFYDCVGVENYSYFGQFTSMEQLWLAFVMKEKYNKRWNGTKWEVIHD